MSGTKKLEFFTAYSTTKLRLWFIGGSYISAFLLKLLHGHVVDIFRYPHLSDGPFWVAYNVIKNRSSSC